MSLAEMRKELRDKYERLCRREVCRPDFVSRLRWKTCPYPKCFYYKMAELTEREFCKRCGSKLEIVPEERFRQRYSSSLDSSSHSNSPELEKLINQVRILAEYGKDPEAENLMARLGLAFVLMPLRDFWNYLYDWSLEAMELLKVKKIKVPTAPMVPSAVYAWARRGRIER